VGLKIYNFQELLIRCDKQKGQTGRTCSRNEKYDIPVGKAGMKMTMV
jgi:hypothetical protein